MFSLNDKAQRKDTKKVELFDSKKLERRIYVSEDFSGI